MTAVFLGLGSNDQPERHLCAALDLLRQSFGGVDVSPVFASESADGEGAAGYLNLVVQVDTALAVGALKALLRDIEQQCGRIRSGEKQSACPLDIDLLLYGDQTGVVDGVTLPHPDILRRSYVLRPLSLLAPCRAHPVQKKTFAALWQMLAPLAPALVPAGLSC